MKKFFFVLLAANLGYFLWYFMIEMPTGFGGAENSDLQLPDGVEPIVLVSELDNNLGSVAKGNAHSAPGQSHTTENMAEPADLWSIAWAMSDQTFDQISDIQYSLAVDSIVRGFKIAYEAVVDTIVGSPVEEVGEIDHAEKLDSSWKTTQKSVDIRTPGGVGSKAERCYELGPFDTMEAVKTLTSIMDSKVSWHQITSSWDEVHVGFWVLYHPDRPPENLEDSKASLVMLKSRGIDNTWLFTAGDLRGSISLGLFKTAARAIYISKILREKGTNSVVQPWITEIEHFRLRVQWNDTRTLLESWLVAYSGKDQEIQISVIKNCERVETDKLRFSQK